MRENNRKPIEKCRKKLPQFTTMNVIDGQAGLVSYFSLIFYSLTIDNILNIIVLLILAGVTIATLTGDNGILTKAQEASEKTKQANAEEQVQLAVVGSIGTDGILNLENLNKELEQIGAYYNGNPISTAGNKIEEGDLPVTVTLDGQEVTIGQSGNVAVGGKIKEYTDEGVPIPSGFYYVGGTKESGVVISDNPADEDVYKDATNGVVGTSLQGNQFVWVPVDNPTDFRRYSSYS